MSRTALLALIALGCGSDPGPSTPEGVGLHVAELVRTRNADGYVAIAVNPNAATIEESGANPSAGGYARWLMDEGERALRSDFDAVASANAVPEGTLRATAAEPGAGVWDISFTTEDGAPVRLMVRVVRRDAGLRVAGVGVREPTN